MRRALLLALVLLAGCPSKEPIAPALTDASQCVAACDVMSKQDCPEGKDPKCVEVISQQEADRLTRKLSCACVSSATSVDEVRKCGVRCKAP